MPKHIQPNGPRGATRQRADFAGSLFGASGGRGGFPPVVPMGRRRERLVVYRHHGAFRSYPHWAHGRKSAPAKCVTNSGTDPKDSTRN